MNSSEARTRTLVEQIGLVATVIMVCMGAVGAVINLAHIQLPLQGELGMPPYLAYILGTAKILGVATFLTSRVPTLREWAYAGYTFELLGAAACHLLAGGGILHAMPALFDLSFVFVSYFLWQRAHTRALDHERPPAADARVRPALA